MSDLFEASGVHPPDAPLADRLRPTALDQVVGQALALYKRIEEAEMRDHRRIGKQQDLFHLQEEAPGLVFWHPKGWALWQVVEQYMRKVYRSSGYGDEAVYGGGKAIRDGMATLTPLATHVIRHIAGGDDQAR